MKRAVGFEGAVDVLDVFGALSGLAVNYTFST